MTDEVRVNIILPPVASTTIDHDLVALTQAIHERFHGDEDYFYGLGGEYGYGTDYENDVFAMRRFYWGDCVCGWTEAWDALVEESEDSDCYQVELEQRSFEAGVCYCHHADNGLDDDERQKRQDAIYKELTAKYGLPMNGCAVHCTCTRKARVDALWEAHKYGPDGHAEDCPIVLPNFHHKPSGLKVEWYKWIGRSMEFNQQPTSPEWGRILEECYASLASPDTSVEGGL